MWYRGGESNSTDLLCKRSAVTRRQPRHGSGGRIRTCGDLINSQAPYLLGDTGTTWWVLGESNPGISCLRGRCFPVLAKDPEAGGAYGNRTRCSSIDSRAPRHSVYAPRLGRPPARVKNWLAAQASNLEPSESESDALPIAPAANALQANNWWTVRRSNPRLDRFRVALLRLS